MNCFVQKFNNMSVIFDRTPKSVFILLNANSNILSLCGTHNHIIGLQAAQVIGKNSEKILEVRFPGIQQLISETIVNRRSIHNFSLEVKSSQDGVKNFLVNTVWLGNLNPGETGIALVIQDNSEASQYRKEIFSNNGFKTLIGDSMAMKEIVSLVKTVAPYDTSILIAGETGTGKELVARAIHQHSPRANGPFIPINCSSLSRSLLESELFGHIKGAFTGAIKSRRGRFEAAQGGTIFLDEVGTLSLEVQVKLLRALQERIIERVGCSEPVPVDVRVISATNQELLELIAQRSFREDLYYRLKVVQVELPALRDRRFDIPLLTEYFIQKFNRLHHRQIVKIAPAAMDLLRQYEWPGNVRELENAIEHALILVPGKIISPAYLPPEILRTNGRKVSLLIGSQETRVDKSNIQEAILQYAGNLTLAAASLGVHRTTLWRKMKRLGINKQNIEYN